MIGKLSINEIYNSKKEYYDLLIRKKLRIALKYRNLKQIDFAHLCNKRSQNAVSRWLTLNSRYKNSIDASDLMAISVILELDMAYFYNKALSCEKADRRNNASTIRVKEMLMYSFAQQLSSFLHGVQEEELSNKVPILLKKLKLFFEEEFP